MTETQPIACSLEPGALKRRLAAIAAIGQRSLIDHESEDGDHLLRFRRDAATRRGLEEIVAAESECCPFLDLALADRGGELVLSIAAPPGGRAAADGLAAAFVGASA